MRTPARTKREIVYTDCEDTFDVSAEAFNAIVAPFMTFGPIYVGSTTFFTYGVDWRFDLAYLVR